MTSTGMSSLVLCMTGTDLGHYTDWLRSWGASRNTIHDRTIVIAAGLRTWGPIDTISTETLATWLGQERFSAWTRVTYYSHLKSYFGWLSDTGRLQANPMIGLRAPRQPRDKPKPLSADDVQHALEVATPRMRAWLILGLYAGLRAHEIAKIRGQDVDRDNLYVFGKGQQGAMLPTHELVWELALQHPRVGWWFPSRRGDSHVAASTVSTTTAVFFKTLGIEGGIHRCRHTFGTRLLRSGSNIRVVQTLMRHTSVATTQKYTAVDEDERAAAIRGLVA